MPLGECPLPEPTHSTKEVQTITMMMIVMVMVMKDVARIGVSVWHGLIGDDGEKGASPFHMPESEVDGIVVLICDDGR